jgi:uncharacterized protein YbgA (DUF1722 family)/uncharacterized protein YbbK (DUF523 family)
MNTPISPDIKIGVSSCLLGENVRFDAGHKKNAFITGMLNDYFNFVPFCPEMHIGLGVPRETIRLSLVDDQVRCIGTKSSSLDVTDKLTVAAEEQSHWHQELSGYILKKDSPSCGMERVKVYRKNAADRIGVGIYAKKLMENFPHLPVEEEGRLLDAKLRENFIQRVYIYVRWQQMTSQNFALKDIQKFHAQHKYILMSHDQKQAKELGSLLAQSSDQPVSQLAETYLEKMMITLKKIATRENHMNTLQHIQGYLKKDIDKDDKAELVGTFTDYKNGLLPLIVPITLLRHHFRKHPNEYITQSYYMSPYPGELMLLNNI